MTTEQLQLIAEDAKGYLNRNYRTEERIRTKKDRIERLIAIATSTSTELKQVVVYTGPSNKVEKCMIEAIDLEAEIREEIRSLVLIQHETAEAIKVLIEDITLREILEKRYLGGKRWEEIAVEMNYAYRWVQRLHARALKQMKREANSRLEGPG